jgi:hypothetical protein
MIFKKLLLLFFIFTVFLQSRDYRESRIEFLPSNNNNSNSFDSVIRFKTEDGDTKEKNSYFDRKEVEDSNERTIRTDSRAERRAKYERRKKRYSNDQLWSWSDFYFIELGVRFSWDSYLLIDTKAPSSFLIDRLIEFNNNMAFIPYGKINFPPFYARKGIFIDSNLEVNYMEFNEQTPMFSNGEFPLRSSFNIGTQVTVLNYGIKLNSGYKIDFKNIKKSYLKMKFFLGAGMSQINGSIATFRYPSVEEIENTTDYSDFNLLGGVVVAKGPNIPVSGESFTYTYGFNIDFVYNHLLVSFLSEVKTTEISNIYFTTKLIGFDVAIKF